MKGCKDCPAYAKCTATYRGSACAALHASYGVDSDPETVTNADKIRSLSDEDLARHISKLFCYGYAEKQLLEWLQQPAKEE